MLSDIKIRNYLKNNQLYPKCRKLHPLKSAFKPPLGTSKKCLLDSRRHFLYQYVTQKLQSTLPDVGMKNILYSQAISIAKVTSTL